MSTELQDLGPIVEGNPATAASTSSSQGADPVRNIFFSIWSEISVKVKLKFQISSVSGCYNTKKLALSARYKGFWTSSSFQTFEC